MKLKDLISKNNIFVIAEAGCNHEGDLNTALTMIEKASEAKAHAIKFQSFTKGTLLAENEYIKILKLKSDALKQMDDIVLKSDWYKPLIKKCKECGIIFLSTPFSTEAVCEMESHKVGMYKVASCDIDNVPLLKELAKTKKPIILSTGLAKNKDIKNALKILKGNETALLHCCVEYPAENSSLNLNRIDIMKSLFKKSIIGYSDHSVGINAAIIAVSKQAKIIEKHFTLTPEKTTFDHALSLDPHQMSLMINSLNDVHSMLGNDKGKKEKEFTEKEKKEFTFAKRGIYLKHDMKVGDTVKEKDLIALRPNIGISVSEWDYVVGKKLKKNINAFTKLSKKDFS